jgi:hypothetical protein
MQNFEILLVDAKDRLDAIAKIPAEMSEAFYVRTMSSSPSLKKNCRLRRPAC